MMRFRWGVPALVAGLVVVLSGCEGFKIVRLSEYEQLRSAERVSRDQEDMIKTLTSEKDRLSSENASLSGRLDDQIELAEMLKSDKERLAEEKKRLAEELATYTAGGGPPLKPVAGMEHVSRPEGAGFVAISDLLFDTGSAQLKAEGKAALDRVVPVLKERSNTIRVCGYTDSQWTGVSAKYESNFHLSAMRALSVLNYLKQKGIASSRMHLAGYGANDLILEGGKENMKKSRRVEIILLYDWATRTGGETAPEIAPK